MASVCVGVTALSIGGDDSGAENFVYSYSCAPIGVDGEPASHEDDDVGVVVCMWPMRDDWVGASITDLAMGGGVAAFDEWAHMALSIGSVFIDAVDADMCRDVVSVISSAEAGVAVLV